MSSTTSRNEKTNEREFSLPRSSFTAFRLAYCTPKEMCEYSKVIFLGNIPDVWLQDHKHNIIKSITKFTRRKISRKFNSAYNSVRSSISRTDQYGDGEDSFETDDFNLFNRHARLDTTIFANNIQSDAGDSENMDNSSIDASDRETISSSSTIGLSKSSYDLSFDTDDMRPNLENLFYKKPNKKTSTQKLIGWDIEHEGFFDSSDTDSLQPVSITDKDVLKTAFASPPELTGDSGPISPSTSHTFYSAKESLAEPTEKQIIQRPENNLTSILEQSHFDTQNGSYATENECDSLDKQVNFASPRTKVAFSQNINDSNGRERKKIIIAAPEPEPMNSHPISAVQVDPSDYDVMKKIKFAASASKGKVKKNISSLEKKVTSRSWLRSYGKGEIIKMEKMLVLVKSSSTTAVTLFTEEETCDTRINERWKEYIVVVRSTGDLDEPLLIQFCQTREISKIDNGKFEASIKLSSSNGVNFYSTVDKTIALTVPDQQGMSIYILRCRTQSSSIKWLSFFKEALGQHLDFKIHVSIPDLNTSMEISIPLEEFEALARQNDQARNLLHVLYKDKGYEVKSAPVLEYMKEMITENLKHSNVSPHTIRKWLQKHQRLGFAFRHFDRLEWIINSNHNLFYSNWVMGLDFYLELREVRHYSRKTITSEGESLQEPPPIEGFLAKLTTRNSNDKTKLFRRNVYRLMYFHTCDNMLFFTKYYRGIPPLPDNELIEPDGTITNIEKLKDLRTKLPDVYEHNPYSLNDDDHFDWLHPATDKKLYEHYDKAALSEMERKTHQIVKAEELIDTCEIVEIRPVPADEMTKLHKFAHSMAWFSSPTIITDPDIIESEFEVIFSNGAKVKLQAPNRFVRDEWMTRLSEISRYWINRKAEDLARMVYIKRKNMAILNMDESMDTALDHISKEEFAETVADPTIFPISNIAMTKCVLMYGQLYQKQKKHANFSQYFVVLCPGFLILYSLFKRSKSTGVMKRTGNYKHYLSIPLSECYVYSGASTAMDLLSRQTEFDHMNPGEHSIPRLYSDGWRSSEEEQSRCFTLWFGTKRMIASRDKAVSKYTNMDPANVTSKNSLPKNPGMISMMRKLGVTGKSIVFMTRSREEKQLWVSKIFTEIDRFSTADIDIKVVDHSDTQ